METKQASMHLRVLWLNDTDTQRPDSLDVELVGEIAESTSFSISENDDVVGDSSPWEQDGWMNGIYYDYLEETEEEVEEDVIILPQVVPEIVNVPANYRCNILKNVETKEQSYYTIKMTYVPPKRRLMTRSSAPSIIMNGTTVENVNLNNVELNKVIFNKTTVFEKIAGSLFKDIILANSTLNEGTPDFSLTATTDEGMFAAEDEVGGGYVVLF